MPYRIAIVMRSGANDRKPHYLRTSLSQPNESDFENLDLGYEFNDDSNPDSYDIIIGKRKWYGIVASGSTATFTNVLLEYIETK